MVDDGTELDDAGAPVPPAAQRSDDDWVRIARDAYSASTSYVDANWRKAWERNIALFQSRHPAGSKYHTDAYKHRSKLFKPKTRSTVRKNEAAAAAAYFSNVDVVSIEPENDSDPKQVVGAAVRNELLNYRLQNPSKGIPWFMTCLGAFQEAQVIGVIASYQYWDYKERRNVSYNPLQDELGQPVVDENGNHLAEQIEQVEIICDKPCCKLLPIENVRFDPASDWTDVVGSSPYFIRRVPMYVDEVRQRMREPDPKTGQPQWKSYSDGTIRSAMNVDDTTRQAREDKRQDPVDNNSALTEFEVVWCHENFIRLDGEEMVFWTLGTLHMLTEPKPLKEVYFHGKRPFVVGTAMIEANRVMPESTVGMGSNLQKEANETTNNRIDNVRLVLNKRWIVKRNQEVDVAGLTRNVAGGVTMVNDVVADIRTESWPDVTPSAYMEQDRINVDFDELMGSFSQSSVQTNRAMNETVGGMQLANTGAMSLTEYLIRTFTETWVEPVLSQIDALECEYETDNTVMQLVGARASDVLERHGVQQVDETMLTTPATVRVNVGMGATDPKGKQRRFTEAMLGYGQVLQMVPDADPVAVRRELFGLAGYRDGQRFFKQGPSPEVMQMQQQLEMMQQNMQQLMQGVQQLQAENQAIKQDNQAKLITAQADAHLKAAQADAAQADAYKTDVEAGLLPEQSLTEEAANAD